MGVCGWEACEDLGVGRGVWVNRGDNSAWEWYRLFLLVLSVLCRGCGVVIYPSAEVVSCTGMKFAA